MNNQPNHKNLSPQETPCPICGSQNFVWGRTVGESVSQWVYFRAEEAKNCGRVSVEIVTMFNCFRMSKHQ